MKRTKVMKIVETLNRAEITLALLGYNTESKRLARIIDEQIKASAEYEQAWNFSSSELVRSDLVARFAYWYAQSGRKDVEQAFIDWWNGTK